MGYYAEKLKDAMKGMTTSEQTLIRILVGRSEKDLGEIVQYFAEENYGEGKTLKQWMGNTLKGSFRTLLLRIAGLSNDIETEQQSNANKSATVLSDYESQTDTEFPTEFRKDSIQNFMK